MLSLSLIPATLQYMSLPFCPESPRYLFINKGKEKEAEAGELNDLKEITSLLILLNVEFSKQYLVEYNLVLFSLEKT